MAKIKKIAITGAKGKIASIILPSIKKQYKIISLDLPETDITDIKKLKNKIKGCSAIIHLAWNLKKENYNTNEIDPKNTLMYHNIYKAALEMKIKRVIMASSIHANNFMKWKNKNKISLSTCLPPVSPYGANKLLMENLGKSYSKKGLEVVCIRFGGIKKEKTYTKDIEKYGLTHPDCISLIKTCLKVKQIPNNFTIIYGISKNKKSIHNTTNIFGWKPKIDAKNFYID